MNLFKTFTIETLSLIRLVSIVFLIQFSFLLSNAQIFNLPYLPYGAVFSDYDLDGDNDIIIGTSSDTIVILNNQGYGSLERIDLPYVNAVLIFCSDVNVDNYPDIITGGSGGGLKYYLNDGTGGFNENFYVIPHDHDNIRIEDVKDMDNNGYPDILYYTFLSPYGWGIIYNNGDGTFTDEFVHQSEYTETLNIDFLNDDNRYDILVSSSNTQPGNYIAYNYSIGFAFDTLFDHSELWVYNTIIDIDLDGDNDILFNKPSILNYGKYLFYENISSENFVDNGYINKKEGTRVDVVSDLDEDNYPDLACISRSSSGSGIDSIYILKNTQNNGFALLDQIYMGNDAGITEHIYSGDLNGDGLPELLVTGYENPTRSHTRLLWNDGTGHFVDSNLVSTNVHLISKLIISARPNPFTEHVEFKIDNSKCRVISLNIHNLQGQLIYEQKIQKSKGTANLLWNGQSYKKTECPPGIYIAHLIVDNKTCTVVKIIKY